jgi:hypothetical protein
MRLLVTGGAGFIGSNFILYTFQHYPDWEIVNLDKLTYAGNLENLKDIERNPRYTFVHGDIADYNLLDLVINIHKGYDAIVNFAAESHVDRSILDAPKFVETNVQGTLTLLESARKWSIPVLFRYLRMKSMVRSLKAVSMNFLPFAQAIHIPPLKLQRTLSAIHIGKHTGPLLLLHAVRITTVRINFLKSLFLLL